MVKHCKCIPQKTENEFCDSCGKSYSQCCCEKPELEIDDEESSEEK